MEWFIGTMGFSYPDWNGPFYPAGMPARNYLAYYSRVFNAVEVDSTFYGTPQAETVLRWAASVPENFRFALKMPQTITHQMGLMETEGLVTEFVHTAQLLGDKLGVILIQFPPSFTTQFFDRLAGFLPQLPAGPRFAVEVRDPSWYTPETETARLLTSFGVCWAATEYPGLPRRVDLTTDFLYARWIGQHGSFKNHTHERFDRTAELQDWRRLLVQAAPKLRAAYGFFNNDYAGFAPATANRFRQEMDLPVAPLEPPQQKRLF